MSKSNFQLSVPKLSVRVLSWKGYPITITNVSENTFMYELPNHNIIVEAGHGEQILFIDDTGMTNIIDRKHIVYRELMYRVLNADVLEDGSYNYAPTLQ